MLSMCAMAPSLLGAATLSVDDAKEIAAEFFQSGDVPRLASKDAFELAYTATDAVSNPTCFVFNAKDGKGFVIISADDTSLPVIGYSDKSTWSVGSVPTSAERVLLEPVKVSVDTRRRVLAHASAMSASKVLETPSWSQEAPFNNSIPNRRLTGCVGLALAEILKYHQYPTSRPASLVNSGEVDQYAWSAMRMDNYRSGYSLDEANAVAALVADAAIGIGTDFGMSSSSAYEVKVPYALTSLFGYDAGVSYKKRQEMSRDAWDQVIVDEIDADRPVLYCGQDVSAGHAFVCDGYEMRGSIPYFHINWGWGGSANGFYATDALNPVVSKAHKYNDLMTIVYGIKPAADQTAWSDIHVTSDGGQIGITLDVADITSTPSFTVRAGALKNISNTDFTGKLSVALFGADGNMKTLLNDGRNFSLVALQTMTYVDFVCSVPAGTSVADGDIVRLVAQPAFSTQWFPVSGDMLAKGDASAKGNEIPYFSMSLPSSSDYADVSAVDNKVIKGRDYSFTVVPKSADKVVTVKANGFILTADANNGYRLSNVLEDQQIDILVQNASDVLSKKVVWVTAGNLQNCITENEAATVKDLTLFGTINANDFAFIRDRMKIESLDLSQTSISALGSNPANAIPAKAFSGYRSLKKIVLPTNLTTLKNGCFNNTGLTSVEIPASVATWEYNVFVGCSSLQEVIVRRSSPAWINWCVFNGTPKNKLVVPVGASAAYQAKEYWQDFKNIIEENPVATDLFTLTVAEQKGLKFNLLTEGIEFNKGAKYQFSVETDGSNEDAIMEVYANSTRLTADASGIYETTINGNTLIHVEFKQPQPTTVDQTWKLTADAGGIGLVTSVVNVPFKQNFTVRANAIKVPMGDDAAKFYGIVLTDKNGAIKEFISSIVSNYYSRAAENLTYNFICQVKEAQVKEGNQIRLATSYDKKNWQLVDAESEGITDRLQAVNNPVVYHNVVMPTSVTGARIEGASSEVVRGMPFTIKASAINPNQRVTVAVNGETKQSNVANANVSIPAVLEDLDVTITVKDADAGDYMVYNIQEGLLASKLEDCPTRVKLVGNMLVSDFDAIRKNASTIIDLDLSDVNIKGSGMTGNQIPENAFAPSSASALSSLKTIILPNSLERIDKNAFARCTQITEITIPAKVTYVGNGAFSSCVNLKKIIAKPTVAPACGNTSPFPSSGLSTMTLEVPKGSEDSYSVPSTWWAMIPLYKAPANAKDAYWVKYDPSRIAFYKFTANPNRIEVGQTEQVRLMVILPNNQSSQFTVKSSPIERPGVVFKVYDNGIDVFNNSAAYSNTAERCTPEQSWSMVGGRMYLVWNPTATSGVTKPQDHELKVEFYYSLNFENKEGANGIKAEIVEMPEGCEWRNVPMNKFQYMVKNQYGSNTANTEVKPVLYKEGSEFKFQLTDIPEKTTPVVTLVSKVMTKTGTSPIYEEREYTLVGNNGIYTIPALEGDTWIRISGVRTYEEGDVIPADALDSVDKEDAITFTELAVSGDVTDEDFETIRENFESVETIDLSDIENETIPAGAFEGMSNLVDVIIPETVTEIGEGAFKDCDGIESLTLPGVTTIGDGAFDGCDNLTSIILPSIGAPAPSGKPGMSKVGAVDGVTAESFRGLNPNCLIYVGSADIPNAESVNIILNKDGNRVAASDITLDANYPFNAPASFNLGDHKISFSTEITASNDCDVDGGWSTIILPFQPSKMDMEEKFDAREGAGIHLLSFSDENSESLTPQSSLLPNHPYLANVCAPFSSVHVTFSTTANENGVGYDVPFTPVPEETVAVGKYFSLYGSYDGETRNVDLLTMNDDASAFISADADSVVAIRPFSAYLCANEGTVESSLAIGEHPLWVYEPASVGVGGTKLYRSSLIELASPTKVASIYYTLDGSDPTLADGSRILYEAPFAPTAENMTVKVVAERKGNVSETVTLNFELKKADHDYNLAQNWNWVSHYAENAVPIAEFATEGISTVLSQTQEVVRDAKYGLVGSLKELVPNVGYKVCVDADSWTGNVAGVAFDPTAKVQIFRGWNWIGCPTDEGSLLISDLMANVPAVEGEMIVGLDGFVQADADGNWVGTLSQFVPGEGYMYYSQTYKEFNYNLAPEQANAAPAKAPVAAIDGYWTVDNHKYAFVMPVIASLDGLDAEDYEVAAFCGNECRGIGAVVDGLLMLNVHGNKGDLITFRFIGNDNNEMLSDTNVVFEEIPVGSFAEPFVIKVIGASAVEALKVGAAGISIENGTIIISGNVSDIKSVEVYDVTGKLIAKGQHSISLGNVDGSVVTVVIRKADSTSSLKLLVK